MSTTGNPLLDITDAMSPYVGNEEVADDEFHDTALPGFKRTLTSRRSIRVFDGEPIPEDRPEGLYGARVRLPYGDLIKEVQAMTGPKSCSTIPELCRQSGSNPQTRETIRVSGEEE